MEEKKEAINLGKKLLKNKTVKIASYMLLSMVIAIGGAWLILGILSPILLSLLIIKW